MFHGRIDDLNIFNYAISVSEIDSLFDDYVGNNNDFAVKVMIYQNYYDNEIVIKNLDLQNISYYQLIEINGKIIEQGYIDDSILSFNGLSAGFYIIRIFNNEKIIATEKLIFK
jgi:hypothetical protein